MIRKLSVLIFAAIFLFACDSSKLYEKHSKVFDNYDWYLENTPSFTKNFSEAPGKCDVLVTFRHMYGFPYVQLPIQLIITLPDGKSFTETVIMDVINKDKEYNADCSGDYCDLEKIALSGIDFEQAGEYSFKLMHMSPVDPLPMVMDVGIVVKKIAPQE